MVEFSNNKWKYSTIGLLAVLAIGFSFPQASAHVTNNVMHMLTHVFDNTEDIREKTDNLPSDPADQSEVEEAQFSKIMVFHINSVGEDDDRLECTSDAALLVHTGLNVLGAGGALQVQREFEGGSISQSFTINEAAGMTFGAEAGETMVVRTLSSGQPDFVFAYVTVQTIQGADITCETS